MSHIVIDARIINSTTGRYVERLLTHLQNEDKTNQYTVLVPSKDVEYWKPTSPNFTIKEANFANYSLAEMFNFNFFLKSLKPDLVHFCMPQQPVLYKGKKVTTFHDLTLLKTYNSDKNWLVFHAKQLVGRHVFKNVLKTSNQIITVSNFTKQDILSTFPSTNQEKISTIYESSDTAKAKPQKLHLPFKQFILYVGQQSDYKNIKRLGDAHQILQAKYPSLGLVLAGKINAAAQKNKVYFNNQGYKNIHFTGFVSNSQLSWLYKNAAAYVFPSLMEGFGLPGLEAMEHQTPVISSNSTCLPEVYGPAAHYFNPTETSAMTTAIDEVLSNPQLQTKLINNGQKQLKKYSWQKTAKQTLAVYKKALKNLTEQS